LAREEAAPCLTDGIGSSKLRKNIGYNDGRAARDSSGKHRMKLPQARHAAVKHQAKWIHTYQETQKKLINVYKMFFPRNETQWVGTHTQLKSSWQLIKYTGTDILIEDTWKFNVKY
jgi:hypothetical protein